MYFISTIEMLSGDCHITLLIMIKFLSYLTVLINVLINRQGTTDKKFN